MSFVGRLLWAAFFFVAVLYGSYIADISNMTKRIVLEARQFGIPQLSERELQRGFTLIELIMVIVMLGILAVYAAPRLFNSNDVYARGFHDETLAYLRYAQKTAIGQRRTVCVNFASSSSLTLSIALNPATFDCTTAGTLTGPKGDVASTTLTSRPGSGVAYNTTPAPVNFNFNGLGQPITGAGVSMATQTIQVVGVNKFITVESATGYVHE